jgi:hypothetical protein
MRHRLGAEPAAGEGVVNIVVRLCDGRSTYIIYIYYL